MGKPQKVRNFKQKRTTNRLNTRKDRASNLKAETLAKERNYQDAEEVQARGKKFPMGYANPANDVNWYTKNNQLLLDTASFSFNNPLGAPFRLNDYFGDPVSKQIAVSYATETVPGLMAFRIALTPGVSLDAASPVNIAALNVYDFIRYQNSGKANYDAPDYMMYLLAMDNMYSAWNWMKRLYGLISSFEQLNRYMPIAYAHANYVDFDDIRSNLANFRAYINSVGARISSFCVPATMNYMVRHSWMFSNVYKDGESEKAQQYIFVPDFFYTYDETSSPKGGQLVPIPIIHGRENMLKFEDIVSIIETMINNLAYSEDIGIMSGDTKKAFGSLFDLSPINPDYQVFPTYSKEVLMQIHNMVMLNLEGSELDSWNITQDPNTNYIIYDPEFTMLNTFKQDSAILNFDASIREPANAMVASRLIYALKDSNVTSGLMKFRTVGSEVVTGAYTYTMRDSVSKSYFDAPVYNGLYIHSTVCPTAQAISLGNTPENAEIIAKVVDLTCQRSNFDWAPKLWLALINPTSGKHTIIGCICDWDVYTQISLDNVDSLNLVALMSEFDIPTGKSF